MKKVVIGLGLVWLLALLPLVGMAQDDTALATLEPYQGEVQVLNADSETWQIITEPTQIGAGDQIRTGEGGWALLTFFEGTFTELLNNTHLLVSEVQAPAEEGDAFKVDISLLIGDTYNVVSGVVDQNSSFEVNMPGMTAAVRGTEWYNRVIPSGCSMVFTEEGTVLTYSPLNEDNPIPVEVGDYIVYNLDGSLDEDLEPELPTDERPEPNDLPPASCGDGVCEENEEGLCALDCTTDLPTCGDHVCDASAGENLLSCEQDCGTILNVSEADAQMRMDKFYESLNKDD